MRRTENATQRMLRLFLCSIFFVFFSFFGGIGSNSESCTQQLEKAKVLVQQGEWKPALALIGPAYLCFEAAGDTFGLVRSLNMEGYVYRKQESWEKAIEVLEKAAHLQRLLAQPDLLRLFQVHQQLGALNSRIGDPNQSLLEYQLAAMALNELEMQEPDFTSGSGEGIAEKRIAVLTAMAVTKVDMGKPDTALLDFSRARSELEKVKQEQRRLGLEGYIYFEMAEAFRQIKDLNRALRYNQLAAKRFARTGNESGLRDLENDLALIYGDMGDHQKELEVYLNLLQKPRQAREGERRFWAILYSNIGRCYTRLDSLEKAHEYHDLAIKEFKLLFGDPSHFRIGTVHLNRAISLRKQKRFQAQKAEVKKAMEAYGNPRYNRQELASRAWIELGMGCQELGELDSARLCFEKSDSLMQTLEIRERKRKISETRILANLKLAGTLEQMAGQEESLELLRKAHQVHEKVLRWKQVSLGGISGNGPNAYSKDKGAATKFRQIEAYLRTAWKLFQATGNPAYAESAFVASDQAKANLLQQTMSGFNAFRVLSKGNPKEILELDNMLKELDRLSLQAWEEGLDSRFGLQFLEQMDQVETAVDAWLRPVVAPALDLEIARTELLDQHPNKAILQYFWGTDEVYAFGMYKGEVAMQSLGDPQALQTAVAEYLGWCNTNPTRNPKGWSPRKAHQKAAKLASRLIPQDWLRPGVERILIVPDGPLASLPFSALAARGSGTPRNYSEIPFLIRHLSFAYDFSLSYHLRAKQISREQALSQTAAAFFPNQSNPAYGAGPLPPIAYVGELNALQEVTDLEVLEQEKAMKSTVLKSLGEDDLVFLGTHGILDPENEHHSHLVCFQKERRESSWQLKQYELYQFPRFRQRMIVLGACHTSNGKFMRGEGSLSLTRAFRLSCSPTVIGSRWVATNATVQPLIAAFSREIATGNHVDRAIQQAQLSNLNHQGGSNVWAHPYHWAHLSLSGVSSPLGFAPKGLGFPF